MPPLHTAETLAGVTAPASSQATLSGGSSGTGTTNNSGIDSTQSPEREIANNTSGTNTSHTNNNNTISAAADSSDNQPSTPQPHLPNANECPQHSTAKIQNSYGTHHLYTNSQPSTTTVSNTQLSQMYSQHIYSQSNTDLQSQQQQTLAPVQHSSYPSYLNSYEQFYQQQLQIHNSPQTSSLPQNTPQMDFMNSNPLYPTSAGVRYNPYLIAPTSAVPSVNSNNSTSNNAMDANSQTAPAVSSATSSLMSPRVVSSTSPSSSSNQMHISGSASSLGSVSAGNSSSPNSAGSLQCKKCGIMCTIESELQEHIANLHGASPYGSSGYASSPYIKEEMQQQTPPSQTQQAQQTTAQQAAVQVTNPGEILDLDSQKMLYPATVGPMGTMIHQPLGNTDPLHSLHSMQQRAGVNSWDQQPQEALSPYIQQNTTESKNLPNHSPFYHSPKQSPYHVTNSSNIIKTEYQPIIKNEYGSDTQQYINDKSFDPTAPNQQQQMMPPAVSSSPAEFPSTTTGGPQDNGQQNIIGNQQFRSGNFEPPSSSSATVPSGPVGGKAANWKSNEARRPKTYNCTACNKWFTSSGHLKRHYNTTLHKNAVKSSGQPDPATLPISVHHHPARDPSGKTGRRGAAAAAAANAANGNGQQQQQPPNPVHPPEPPNSPQDYGGAQVTAGSLTTLSHYTATPSPNSMYQQQQYQQQYMPQVQSTTNASPQHASSMTNHHLQQHQNQQQPQQQTVMNGHPNALAGLSVPPTQEQTPMSPSQMRGLLKKTKPLSTATAIRIIKSEHLEGATTEQPCEEVEELVYLTKVKGELLEETDRNMYSGKSGMELVEGEELGQEESDLVLRQHHLQEADQQQEVGVLREGAHNAELHHNTSHLEALNPIQHFQLEQQHPVDMEHTQHNSSHSNTEVHSPLIISHQLYQEELQQQHQMPTLDTYTHTQIQSPPQQLQHNITEHQPYINMPSDINTQQPNNMLQLQQPLTTTEQQLPPVTIIPTTNMDNMQPLNHLHMQQPQPPQQHMELHQLLNTQLQLDTINTNIPSHITTTSNITNIPSYHQLQQPGSVLPPLDTTLTYPHTIIGNAEILTMDVYGNLLSASGHHQQVIQTGQLVQLISTDSTSATTLRTTQSFGAYTTQGSPQAGDLPPATQYCPQRPMSTNALTAVQSFMPYSPPQVQPDSTEITSINTEMASVVSSTKTSKKRKRNVKTSSSARASKTQLPSGPIRCVPCNKEFTKNCYLTQHNKSSHSGEYPFRCEMCGKRYQVKAIYLVHLERHNTTDKAHKCELCIKQFHHKTDLRRHVDSVHNDIKQHACSVCEKGFCRKDHMRKHEETHNRPRPPPKKKSAKAKATKVRKKPKANTIVQTTTPMISSIQLNSSAPAPLVTQRSSTDNSFSSTTTPSTPSPLMQQMDDVVIEKHILENDLNEYDVENMEDNEEYIAVTQYGREIQSHYRLGKNEIYNLVEHDLAMF